MAAAACRPRCAARASGLADNWLRHVQDVHEKHEHALRGCGSESAAADRLCELNVIEQVRTSARPRIARDAWERGQELSVHGWIYGIADGLVRDLEDHGLGLSARPRRSTRPRSPTLANPRRVREA